MAIAVDHPDDVAAQSPMIGRLLLLAVVDILAVGVAMRAGTAAGPPAAADVTGAPPVVVAGAAAGLEARFGRS